MARQTGIRVRHGRACASSEGRRCNCRLSYEASVFSARDGKKVRRSFPTEAAARQWRADAQSALGRGGLRAPTPTTVREAAENYLAGMRDGSIRNKRGHAYKPSVIRNYERDLRLRALPALGAYKLSAVTSADVQALVDRMLGEGHDPNLIQNTLMPLRAIYRRACRPGGEVAVNPTRGLEIPATKQKRDRIATPAEAERLIGVLQKRDQALWATAFYAGLRLGELLALDWSCIDLAGGVIRVERSYDPVAREFIDTKTEAGDRRVPIAALLRDHLLGHKFEIGRSRGLVFGRTDEIPFDVSSTNRRAKRAWAREDAVACGGVNLNGDPCRGTPKRGEAFCWRHAHLAGVDAPALERQYEPIGFHEARHTFASLMIDAGVNIKALSTFIGHRSVSTTIDRYGHLMPGGEEEAAARIDAYLERANTQARMAQIEAPATLEHAEVTPPH